MDCRCGETRGAIADAVRRLDAAASAWTTSACSGPTLDDVFLSLTGRAAEETGASDPHIREPPDDERR